MRDIRRGSAWPDSRPGIVAGGGLNLPARPRPGHSFPERAGMGGGVDITGVRFIEDFPGEVVIDTPFPSDLFLVEDTPGELVLDDTVTAGLKIRATASGIFVSD